MNFANSLKWILQIIKENNLDNNAFMFYLFQEFYKIQAMSTDAMYFIYNVKNNLNKNLCLPWFLFVLYTYDL